MMNRNNITVLKEKAKRQDPVGMDAGGNGNE